MLHAYVRNALRLPKLMNYSEQEIKHGEWI